MRHALGAVCLVASVLLAALFVWFSMWQSNALGEMCDQLSRDGVVNWERFSAANRDLPATPGGLARFIDQGYSLRVFTTGCVLAVIALLASVRWQAGDGEEWRHIAPSGAAA